MRGGELARKALVEQEVVEAESNPLPHRTLRIKMRTLETIGLWALLLRSFIGGALTVSRFRSK